MKICQTNMNNKIFNPQLMGIASVVLVTGLTVAPAMADVDNDADLNAAADTAVQQPADNQAEAQTDEAQLSADADVDVDADNDADIDADVEANADDADMDVNAQADAQSDSDWDTQVEGNHGALRFDKQEGEASTVKTDQTRIGTTQVDPNEYESLSADDQARQSKQQAQSSQTQQRTQSADANQDYDPRQQYDFIIGDEDNVKSIPEGNLPPNEAQRNQRLASPQDQTRYQAGDQKAQPNSQTQTDDNRTLELRRQSPAGFGEAPSKQDNMSAEQDRNVFNESDAQSSNENFQPREDARIYRNADQQQDRTYVIEENTQAWDQDVSGNHGELRFDQPTTRYRVIQQAAPQQQTQFQADRNQSDAELTDQSRTQQQPLSQERVEMEIIDSKVIDSSDRRSQTLGSVERPQRVEADDSQLRERRELKSERRPDSRVIELRRQSPSGYTDNQANSVVDDANDARQQAQQQRQQDRLRVQQGSIDRNQRIEADADMSWDAESDSDIETTSDQADENWDTQVEGNHGELRLNEDIGTGDLETRASADQQFEAEANVDADPNVTQELGNEADVDVDADIDAEPTENQQM